MMICAGVLMMRKKTSSACDVLNKKQKMSLKRLLELSSNEGVFGFSHEKKKIQNCFSFFFLFFFVFLQKKRVDFCESTLEREELRKKKKK